jgi:hypothetical protein
MTSYDNQRLERFLVTTTIRDGVLRAGVELYLIKDGKVMVLDGLRVPRMEVKGWKINEAVAGLLNGHGIKTGKVTYLGFSDIVDGGTRTRMYRFSAGADGAGGKFVEVGRFEDLVGKAAFSKLSSFAKTEDVL